MGNKKADKKALTPRERMLAGLRPIKKGEVRNPNGRPKGARDVKVVIREAMMKIGSTLNMTPEEVEQLMHESGIKQALKGNVKYYNALSDRLYGPVDKNRTNVTVNVAQEPSEKVKELTKKLNDVQRKG
jgi:hypothetical protein